MMAFSLGQITPRLFPFRWALVVELVLVAVLLGGWAALRERHESHRLEGRDRRSARRDRRQARLDRRPEEPFGRGFPKAA